MKPGATLEGSLETVARAIGISVDALLSTLSTDGTREALEQVAADMAEALRESVDVEPWPTDFDPASDRPCFGLAFRDDRPGERASAVYMIEQFRREHDLTHVPTAVFGPFDLHGRPHLLILAQVRP